MSLSREEAKKEARQWLRAAKLDGRQIEAKKIAVFCSLQITRSASLGEEVEELSTLLACAPESSVTFDGVCKALSRSVQEKEHLTENARAFMAGVLDGSIVRPREGSRSVHENIPRNRGIINALRHLEQCGIKPTINEAKLGWCGCDIVSEVLRDMRVSGANSVPNVWKMRHHLLYAPPPQDMASGMRGVDPALWTPWEPLVIKTSSRVDNKSE